MKYKLILFLGILLILSLIWGSYNYGFKHGYEKDIEEIVNFYDIWNLDTKELYTGEFKGIKLYSDVDNFKRIIKLMTELNISNQSYLYLNGIAYYQNDSFYKCRGQFDANFVNVELWKCDENFSVRGNNITREYSEKFILLHELGHYILEETNSDGQQEFSDNYAIKKLIQIYGEK